MECNHSQPPSYYTYKRLKCRSDKCKAANAEYKRNKTAYYRSLATSENDTFLEAYLAGTHPQYTHGVPNTYEWYQCKCDACTEAIRIKKQGYRSMKKVS